MPTIKEGSSRKDGADCTHCHPGHKRWADVFWGVMEFIRQYDPPAHRAIRLTLGLGMDAPPPPVPGLLAVHPSQEAQQWAAEFRRKPIIDGASYRAGKGGCLKVQLKKGRRPDIPPLGELMVHGVVMWHLRQRGADRDDPQARAYDLQEQWPDVLKHIPRSVCGDRLPRRRDTPDFNEMVADGPTTALLAIRLTARILGHPDRTMENRLTAARRRHPDMAKFFRLWRATGLEMIESR